MNDIYLSVELVDKILAMCNDNGKLLNVFDPSRILSLAISKKNIELIKQFGHNKYIKNSYYGSDSREVIKTLSKSGHVFDLDYFVFLKDYNYKYARHNFTWTDRKKLINFAINLPDGEKIILNELKDKLHILTSEDIEVFNRHDFTKIIELFFNK